MFVMNIGAAGFANLYSDASKSLLDAKHAWFFYHTAW